MPTRFPLTWLLPLVLAACLFLPGIAAAAPAWQQVQTIAAIDSSAYDLAVAGGKVHVAYQTGGKIYYAFRRLTGMGWTIREIGTGATPSIAANDTATYLAYANGGSIYLASSVNAWTPTLVTAGTYGSLGCEGNGTLRLLVEGNFDGDPYDEFRYLFTDQSGWSAPVLIQDGWFSPGSGGEYFRESSLCMKPGGGYYYAFCQNHWGTKASWSFSSMVASATFGFSYDSALGQYPSGNMTRQSITSGSAGTAMTFTFYGNVYRTVQGGSSWGAAVNLGAGSAPTIDASNGLQIAYANGGTLYTYDTVATSVSVGGTALTGSNPFIAGDGTDHFILYKNTGNQLALVGTTTLIPPALSINDVSVTEGNAGTVDATLTVSLSEASPVPVTVNYATADDTALASEDYAAASSQLTFSPGEVAKTVTIQVNGDETREYDETFFVNLSNAANATIADASGVVTIISDEYPLFTVTAGVTAGDGTLDPTGDVSAEYRSNLIFTATPNDGWGVAGWTLDGESAQTGGTTFEVLDIQANHTVGVAFYLLPPTVDAFTPDRGFPGTTVTITGTYLTGATAVTFNGVPSTDFLVVNATTITAVAPANATTGVIAVTTPADTASSVDLFTVLYVQPDLTIKGPNDVATLGEDIYNDTPSQTSTATATGTVSYNLVLGNDGNTADTLTLTGTGSTEGWTVRYFDLRENGGEVTDAVTGDGWSVALQSAETVPVRMDVTIAAAVKGNVKCTATVSVISSTDAVKGDTIIADTTKQALQSVTLNANVASPILLGQSVTFTGTANGGGTPEYRFAAGTYVNGVTTWPNPMPAWQTSNSFTWTPTEAGAFRIIVYAREQGTTLPIVTSIVTYVVKSPLTSVSLGIAPASPQPLGRTLTLTASSTGGRLVEYEFKAKYLDGATTVWVPIQNFNANAVCNWTPTLAKTYTIYLTAREQNATTAQYKYAPSQIYTINPALSAMALTITPTSPKALGSTLTLKATPTGGTKVEYEFKAKYTDPINGVIWVNIQAFTLNGSTVTWTPAEARTYTIYVTAREQGSLSDSWKYASQNYTITPVLASVSLQVIAPWPRVVNQPITLRANAVGGAKVEYEFKAKYTEGGVTTWVPIQAFTLGSFQVVWTPTEAHIYTVYVTAREQGSLSATWKYGSQNVSVVP